MELSDEQKRRILDEEHRMQVRQELQDRTAATNPTSPVVEPPKAPKRLGGETNYWRLFRRVLAAICAILWIVEAIERSLRSSGSEAYGPSVIRPAIIGIGWIVYLVVDVKMGR